jgi:thiamine kinase-like enzyme
MEIIKLVGHSGCRLEIRELDGKLVVVKTAKDKAYSERLKKQYEKQKAFQSDSFLSPVVLDAQHNDDGLFEFSMEYVNGSTLAEYFKEATISSIEELAEKFLSLIPAQFDFDPAAKDIFSAKIKDLRSKMPADKNGMLEKAFQKLDAYEWAHCVSGDCHGDMALENIIWKNGELYLIDFLDSFYDGWMIDLAKLLLDVECFWSYRHEETVDENLRIRLLIFKDIIRKRILSLTNGEALLDTVYHILLLHLIRIIPYAQDEKTRNYLMECVDKINDIIKAS